MPKITENDLKELKELILMGQKAVETRLTAIETHLTTLESGQTAIETRLTGMETRLTTLESGQTTIENRLTTLESGQTAIETRLTNLESGQIEVKQKLGIIESCLDEWRIFVHKVPDLAEKVGELKNWRQIVLITITASISGAIGWLIRGGYIKP